MKILHIISSMVRGGRERQLATIFKHSTGRKLQSKILIFNRTKNDYLSEYGIIEDDVFFLEKKDNFGRLMEIKHIIKQYKPDLLYAWGGFEAGFCLLLSPFMKTKFINGSVRHGIVTLNRKHISRVMTLHLSKYIVANSKAGLLANKLHRGYVLYNGVDKKFTGSITSEEKKAIVQSVFKDYHDEPLIISVANLIPYKDFFTIINALFNLKRIGITFKYMVIGEGPMRHQLEEKIENLGLKKDILLLGRTDKVQTYLQAADIFVHSSKGEGCSNAILEAMSAGLPIIASDTGGTSEITGTNNGCLFTYKNVNQLSSALESHLINLQLLDQKGKISKAIIKERFTVEKMIDNYYSILNKIAG